MCKLPSIPNHQRRNTLALLCLLVSVCAGPVGAAEIATPIPSSLSILSGKSPQGNASAPAASPASTPQARLDAIREALAGVAMQAPTRVRANAWVDQRGALHENTRVTSDVQLRGVRVTTYLEEAGALKAQVSTEQITPLIGRNQCGTPLKTASNLKNTPLKRHASIETVVSPIDGRTGLLLMPEIAEHAQRLLTDRMNASGAWLVSPAAQLHNTTYENILFGNSTHVSRSAGYLIRLQIEPDTSPAIAVAAPETQPSLATFMQTWLSPNKIADLRFALRMTVTERQTGRVLWQNATSMRYPSPSASITRTPLPLSMIETLGQTLSQWHAQWAETMACEPLQFQAALDPSGLLVLQSGSRNGVQVGDQFVIFDRAQIPGKILEKGVAAQMALVEVFSLGPDRALLKPLAGELPKNTRQLTAMLP